MPIDRNIKSKWYVSPDEYPGKDYPNYCPGFTILYSVDAALKIYKAVQSIPYFWIDDVHVTGDANLVAKIPFPKSHELITKSEIRKDLIDGKLRIEDHPHFFGFFNIGDIDMRKLWSLVECRQNMSSPYCQVLKAINEMESL